jgi:adenosylcobyric acid synthase
MAPKKILARRSLRAKGSLGTLALEGYEIHHGRTHLGKGAKLEAAGPRGQALLVSGGRGRVWGSYLHGLLDGAEFRNAFFTKLARARGKAWNASARSLNQRREQSLQRWAGTLERNLDLGFLPRARKVL